MCTTGAGVVHRCVPGVHGGRHVCAEECLFPLRKGDSAQSSLSSFPLKKEDSAQSSLFSLLYKKKENSAQRMNHPFHWPTCLKVEQKPTKSVISVSFDRKVTFCHFPHVLVKGRTVPGTPSGRHRRRAGWRFSQVKTGLNVSQIVLRKDTGGERGCARTP